MKKSYSHKKIIYSINIQDIQDVAKDNWDRELTSKELDVIINEIGDRIPWYESIYDTIKDKLSINKDNSIRI